MTWGAAGVGELFLSVSFLGTLVARCSERGDSWFVERQLNGVTDRESMGSVCEE
jgi:hypothetical protein